MMELRVGIIALVAVAYALCYLHVVAPPFGKYSCGSLILLNYFDLLVSTFSLSVHWIVYELHVVVQISVKLYRLWCDLWWLYWGWSRELWGMQSTTLQWLRRLQTYVNFEVISRVHTVFQCQASDDRPSQSHTVLRIYQVFAEFGR